ncbi:hypothetical protein MS3_00010666 [Schistosoma haematobium]|uniref:Uncharacterized protein n=1 Tax=Schistosoma haematobium TaxID=6185 RepID=A0A922LL58_SCHHA|nr:hypothetical protein MS3_00010666 [Schistosoma haematobium]KAH9588282.1 hypothetical protein MS3_00010666 [Schistosoma haematobium]CAH8562213.1 unnamed protein product [Schistosoma haematobium]
MPNNRRRKLSPRLVDVKRDEQKDGSPQSRNAAFTLQILVFTPVSDPPCSSIKLPRKVNVSNSLSRHHYVYYAHNQFRRVYEKFTTFRYTRYKKVQSATSWWLAICIEANEH